MPRPLAVLFLLATAVAGLAGCDSAGGPEQLLFEDQAFQGASDGPTADDWRVGPIFGASVQVTVAATPNPATAREPVTLQFYSDDGLGTFALYVREADGGLRLVRAEGGPPYTFVFFAGDATPTGGAGSSRLVVLDGLRRVVTYGDLVLR